jgi:hypothetical protein
VIPDLSAYPRETLARWWCELNTFRWPSDFPTPAPAGWDGLRDLEKYRLPGAMAAWAAVIPRAEALAYWNGPFLAARRAGVFRGNIATRSIR